ncbi:MAG: P-loop NTPase [Waddliaceae bacterium]
MALRMAKTEPAPHAKTEPAPHAKTEPAPHAKQIIAIAAGKGGVGKSAVTVNLALSLKNKGFSVGILDADLYGPSIRKMLPETQMPGKRGERLTPALSCGIPIISMAYFRAEDTATAVRAPIANRLIQQFLSQIDWPALDYLLIDFPPGTGDIPLTLGQHANLSGAVIVTTPQEISLQDVRKAIQLFTQMRVPILGIVENMSFYCSSTESKVYPFGRGGGEKLSQEYKVPLLTQIPLDPRISESGDLGKPIEIQEFDQLAESLLNIVKERHPSLLSSFINQNETFQLFWEDGTKSLLPAAVIQSHCPCAKCIDDTSNLENVCILDASYVGRYALKFAFNSGCSSGIYSIEALYELSKAEAKL